MMNVPPTRTATIPVSLDFSVLVTREHVRSINEKSLQGERNLERTTNFGKNKQWMSSVDNF